MVQTTQNFELFDQKKNIYDEALTPFWKMFLLLKQLFNAKLLIWRLQFFCVQNKNGSQVKGFTKYGRPD